MRWQISRKQTVKITITSAISNSLPLTLGRVSMVRSVMVVASTTPTAALKAARRLGLPAALIR